LKYNKKYDCFENNTDVHIRPGKFGSTKGVEYLIGGPISDSLPYFNTMVKYFTARGYKRDKSIRAAPYDWRLASGIAISMWFYTISMSNQYTVAWVKLL